jgi:hypothetical protein
VVYIAPSVLSLCSAHEHLYLGCILSLQARQLREAQASLHRHHQQSVIAAARPGLELRSAEKCVQFGVCKEMNLHTVIPFARNCQRTLDLSRVSRSFIGSITKDGANRGQTEITAAW